MSGLWRSDKRKGMFISDRARELRNKYGGKNEHLDCPLCGHNVPSPGHRWINGDVVCTVRGCECILIGDLYD